MTDVMSMGEEQLARRVVELGDEAALSELAVRSYDYVQAKVRAFRHPASPGVGIPRDDWDDAAQDAWLRTRQMLANLRDPRAFRGALRTAVTNACLDWCRRDLRHDLQRGGSLDELRDSGDGSAYAPMEAQLASIAGRRPGVADAVAGADELERALALLPDKQRAVVQLTDQGYSSKEIAVAMGESVANIDQLRSRAYRRLREELR